MPNQSTQFTFDRVVRIVIAILVVLCLLWLINRLASVLLPFFVACLIAYILEPFVQFNRKLLNLRGRTTAIFVSLFEGIFITAMACYFVAPMIASEMNSMSELLRQYSQANASVRYIPDEIQDFLRRNLDFKALSEMLTRQEWATIIENTLRTTWSVISGSISIVLSMMSWLLVFLYVVFIMLDYERLGRGFRRMVPPRYRDVVFKIGNDIKVSMNNYFRGQSLVALLVGILFAIGFSIVGLPMAIVLGLFIGLLNMVPYLQIVSIVPTTLLCLIYAVGGGGDFWVIFWQCMAVYIVVQGIQDMYLVPKIMGKAMGINPAIILLSLSVWGSLLGMIGLIIALPLTTLLLSYYNQYVIKAAEKELKEEEEATLNQTPSEQ